LGAKFFDSLPGEQKVDMGPPLRGAGGRIFHGGRSGGGAWGKNGGTGGDEKGLIRRKRVGIFIKEKFFTER